MRRTLATLVSLLSVIASACGSQQTEPVETPPVGGPMTVASVSERAPAIYRVSVVEEGQSLAVSLSVGRASAPRAVDLPEVSDRADRRANIDRVRCGDRPAIRGTGETSGWLVDEACREVQYTVRLHSPPSAGLDPRHLVGTYDSAKNQWLIPGSSAFLIPAGQSERPALELRTPTGVPIHHTLADASRLGVQLPPTRSLGRVLLGFGAFPTAERSDGQTTFSHHFDVVDAIPLEGIEAGVEYVKRVTGLSPAADVDVYWLGRDTEEEPRLTGHAYSNAIVVSYARDLPEDASASRRKAPLAVFFHQFFVSLVGPNAPEWLAQSLGQYFALKAWQRAGVIDEVGLAALLRSGAASSPDETVLDAYARWRREDTADAWSRFYRLALGFWMALDSHLERSTDGATRLDDVASKLIGLFYDDEGRPPMQFLAELSEAGAPDASVVTSEWLRWPGNAP